MSDDNVRHEGRPIMKKAIALLVAAMLLTGLSACGGSTTADAPAKSDGTSKTETNKEEPKPQPADLTGTWKQTNSNDPSSYMEATISGDTIEVDWIGTDTKSLYWKGTYQAPAAAGDWKWTSQDDTETMASALLASQDATKDFTYSEAESLESAQGFGGFRPFAFRPCGLDVDVGGPVRDEPDRAQQRQILVLFHRPGFGFHWFRLSGIRQR